MAETLEPITDAQAEAALLALGPCLEWTCTDHREDGEGNTLKCRLDSGVRYEVKRSAMVGAWSACFYGETYWYNWKDKSSCPGLMSECTAKAACERHHATGNWA